MRLIIVLLVTINLILISFNTSAQEGNIATLKQEIASIQSSEGTISFDYANKALELAHAHQYQKEFSEAAVLVKEINTVLQIYIDSLPPSYEEELLIKEKVGVLRLEQLYIVWQGYFLQEKYDTAEAILNQKDWIERCIRIKLYDKVLFLLNTVNERVGSNHQIYLTNWQKAYNYYNTSYLYNLKESERLWLSICTQRAKKNGEESPSHLEVLFGFANFSNRTNKVDQYLSLKIQVEKHWPKVFKIVKDSSSISENTALTIVKKMPLYPGCENIEEGKEQKDCADKKLLQFIYSHIKYPTGARKDGIEGMAVITFVITIHGTISNIEILRNPGGSCGEEALRVTKLLNELPVRWSPGKQDDKVVPVKYHLPVRFKLN
jgi:TonB family protein